MAELLGVLAATDPQRALTLALDETNRDRRALWLHAALCGWAARAPCAAAAWIDAHRTLDRENAESAVMEGALTAGPDHAVALAEQWIQQNPANARLHANQLLRVLSDRGTFEAGIAFTATLPLDQRTEAAATAWQYWARSQPERALDAAQRLVDAPARQSALEAIADGWAYANPAQLADVATKLPDVADRTRLLETALREWVRANPKAATAWMNRFDSLPEIDAGAAAIATQPTVVAVRPALAVEWAESITRADLKSSTLASVVREWSTHDPAAALAYAVQSPLLLASDRRALLDEMTVPK